MTKLSSFHTIITQLSNCVSTLSPAAIHLFNLLYRGEEASKNVSSTETGDEINVISITNILNNTNNPLIRAKKIIELIDKIFLAVEKASSDFKNFQRSDDAKKKFVEWSEDHLKTCIEGCLLLKEALDNGIFPAKKIKEEKVARKMVNFFLGWKSNGAIMSEKLGEFNTEKDVINVAMFQQLCGGIPIAPIADSIMPFNMLDWQKNMFLALRKKANVIVSAPTSSGKTMIALGYIIAFLMNEPKSILVYIVPNNVLALEISAILNRFIEGKVSTILDKDSERKQDERTIILTPSGAMQSGFIDTELPENALLIIDEIHTIMGNIELEMVLREMSRVQTLLLSATISEVIIEKLAGVINNEREKVIIKENTQFIVAQDMIPRWCGGGGSNEENEISLLSINPICNIKTMDEVESQNLSLTARDVTILFNKIVKTFGIDGTPEYLAPIPFFCKYGCQKPEKIIFLDGGNTESDEEESDEESEAVVGGIVKRLSMNDIQKWQSCLIEFMNKKSDESIIKSYHSIVNNNQLTLACTPKNAFLVIEECKKKDMFPALFFFKSLYGAIHYTGEIIKLLDNKQSDVIVRDKKPNVKVLEKQIASLSKMKGNGKELRARREIMEFQLQQSVHSEMIAVSDYKCLSKDGGISPENFNKYVEMLKNWNKKFTKSHLLGQMVLYGIGILSGDMPFDIQVFIRGLFNSGIISLLMTTTDCAYGINTPTKTVIVSEGISEIDRKQMKGRAGRKGLGFRAFFIQFGRGERSSPLTLTNNKSFVTLTNNKSFVTPPCQLMGMSEQAGMSGQEGVMGEPGFSQGERSSVMVYHYDPVVYKKFKDEDWINKDIQHILFLRGGGNSEVEAIDIDKEFYKKSYLLFGLGAIIAPNILKELIKETQTGESNRNIRIILGLIGCIPQNNPYQTKEDWNFNIPEKVIKIYRNNGFTDFRPNWFAYQWLMNQKNDFSFSEKEECIENGKYWSYLFFLLSPIFRKILGENKGDELYNDIQGLITNSIINM
jgi:hypothetical protein